MRIRYIIITVPRHGYRAHKHLWKKIRSRFIQDFKQSTSCADLFQKGFRPCSQFQSSSKTFFDIGLLLFVESQNYYILWETDGSFLFRKAESARQSKVFRPSKRRGKKRSRGPLQIRIRGCRARFSAAHNFRPRIGRMQRLYGAIFHHLMLWISWITTTHFLELGFEIFRPIKEILAHLEPFLQFHDKVRGPFWAVPASKRTPQTSHRWLNRLSFGFQW